MKLHDWIQLQGDLRERLLRDAQRIAAHLPAATPGSMVALAFGRDRHAFAASLLACWLRGHGAAVVENTLRERIMPVLEHEAVRHLLHDTDSGRTLQVPQLLARDDQGRDADAAPPAAAPLPASMLAVHVQTDDGDLHWCSWDPQQLADATDTVARQRPERGDGPATPGLASSLFLDTLAALRGHARLAADARRVATLELPGVPPTTSRHTERLQQLLAHPGIDDAAIVHDRQGRALVAVVGDGAAELAATMPNTVALESIPRDPNGQPLRAELCLRFGLGRDGQPVQRELDWTEVCRGDDDATFRTELPADYLFYEGHFTGYPVLAGGVQLHELVLPRLRALVGELPQLQQLDGIKFLARFVPGETIDVALQRQQDRSKVTFEVRRGETRCTAGRLVFAAEVPPLTTAGGPTS
jgi:3-hydroxymyristoyl/3-hydroxydecanoyl-(acyl carrier protein) dehydratase